MSLLVHMCQLCLI